MAKLFANSGDPDRMLHSAASDYSLHCLLVIFFGLQTMKLLEAPTFRYFRLCDLNIHREEWLNQGPFSAM